MDKGDIPVAVNLAGGVRQHATKRRVAADAVEFGGLEHINDHNGVAGMAVANMNGDPVGGGRGARFLGRAGLFGKCVANRIGMCAPPSPRLPVSPSPRLANPDRIDMGRLPAAARRLREPRPLGRLLQVAGAQCGVCGTGELGVCPDLLLDVRRDVEIRQLDGRLLVRGGAVLTILAVIRLIADAAVAVAGRGRGGDSRRFRGAIVGGAAARAAPAAPSVGVKIVQHSIHRDELVRVERAGPKDLVDV